MTTNKSNDGLIEHVAHKHARADAAGVFDFADLAEAIEKGQEHGRVYAAKRDSARMIAVRKTTGESETYWAEKIEKKKKELKKIKKKIRRVIRRK